MFEMQIVELADRLLLRVGIKDEQYMMAEKARIFGDEETRQRIMKEEEPSIIKDLGREVKNFNPEIWDQHKFDVVVKGNLAKFGQDGLAVSLDVRR